MGPSPSPVYYIYVPDELCGVELSTFINYIVSSSLSSILYIFSSPPEFSVSVYFLFLSSQEMLLIWPISSKTIFLV